VAIVSVALTVLVAGLLLFVPTYASSDGPMKTVVEVNGSRAIVVIGLWPLLAMIGFVMVLRRIGSVALLAGALMLLGSLLGAASGGLFLAPGGLLMVLGGVFTMAESQSEPSASATRA
jgi:hypothetical protein